MGLYFDINKFNKDRFNELADAHRVVLLDDTEDDDYEDLYNLKKQREMLDYFFESFKTPGDILPENDFNDPTEKEEYDFHELTKERLTVILSLIKNNDKEIDEETKSLMEEIINDLLSKTDFDNEVITFNYSN